VSSPLSRLVPSRAESTTGLSPPNERTDFDTSLDRSKAVYTAEQSEEQKFVAIAVLEVRSITLSPLRISLIPLFAPQCRGCEITAFDPKGIWSCKGTESGTKFDEVELSLEEPDGWTDYDEKVSFRTQGEVRR
jgi:hypothetical protein